MGNVVVSGVSSTANVIAGDGTTLSYHGSSNGTIAAGDGDDTVIASAGNDTIALGAGNNDIQLGTGNSLVYSDGHRFDRFGLRRRHDQPRGQLLHRVRRLRHLRPTPAPRCW